MVWNNETLDKIKALSYILTPPNDIADVLEISRADFIMEMKDQDSDVFKYFNKGFLTRCNEINKKVVKIDGNTVDSAEFTAQQIKDFRLKILIQTEY